MHPQGQDPLFPVFQSEPAFAAYQRVRSLLPEASFPATSRTIADLQTVAAEFDAFVFDAYGVLNVGEVPIPGAVACVDALLAAGKTCVVITNAASFDRAASIAKFDRLGFSFPHGNVVTSRQAAEEALLAKGSGDGQGMAWAVLGLDPAECGVLPDGCHFPGDDATAFDAADGFLFPSTLRWSASRQALLIASLARQNRPVVIGNPDIVAPREGGFSTEPGHFGYQLALEGLGNVEFHGKPFPSVYALARRGHPAIAESGRVLMIGDTLHTDVLGGASQGWKTALVTGHGLFKDAVVADKIAQSGIVPGFILPSI